ncbi:hypothetical protein BdWA1_001718 [Babesia duncani]|uniref:Uncharacterized protein n=1 Tax=Babesia duncani TaxID=323732 RepID=A0AAD9PL53_9APIC|nr:hypothetical protein BdWA1_001718 [Babesia duncani]
MKDATMTSLYTINMLPGNIQRGIKRYDTINSMQKLIMLYCLSTVLTLFIAAHSIYIFSVADPECYGMATINIMYVLFQIAFDVFYLWCLNKNEAMLISYRGLDKISAICFGLLLCVYNGVESGLELANTSKFVPYHELQYAICAAFAVMIIIKVVEFVCVSNHIYYIETNMFEEKKEDEITSNLSTSRVMSPDKITNKNIPNVALTVPNRI